MLVHYQPPRNPQIYFDSIFFRFPTLVKDFLQTFAYCPKDACISRSETSCGQWQREEFFSFLFAPDKPFVSKRQNENRQFEEVRTSPNLHFTENYHISVDFIRERKKIRILHATPGQLHLHTALSAIKVPSPATPDFSSSQTPSQIDITELARSLFYYY